MPNGGLDGYWSWVTMNTGRWLILDATKLTLDTEHWIGHWIGHWVLTGLAGLDAEWQTLERQQCKLYNLDISDIFAYFCKSSDLYLVTFT